MYLQYIHIYSWVGPAWTPQTCAQIGGDFNFIGVRAWKTEVPSTLSFEVGGASTLKLYRHTCLKSWSLEQTFSSSPGGSSWPDPAVNVYNTIWWWWYIFYFIDKKTKVRLDIPQVSLSEHGVSSRGKLWVLGWVEVPDLSLRSRWQMSAGIIEFPWSNYNRWQVAAVQCTAVAII